MEQLGRYYKVPDWRITCGQCCNSSYLKACWHYLLGCSCNGAVIAIHIWFSHTVFCCYKWWWWYIRNALIYIYSTLIYSIQASHFNYVWRVWNLHNQITISPIDLHCWILWKVGFNLFVDYVLSARNCKCLTVWINILCSCSEYL